MFYRLVKPIWAQETLPNGEKNPKFVKNIEGPNIYEGCFPETYLRDKNNLGYNIYFFPNHPKSENVYKDKKFLSGKDIDVFNYIFVDMDLKDGVYESKEAFLSVITEFKIRSSRIIDSGNGIHVYWKVSDLSRDMYVLLQLALINKFKTDESVWTVLQLMRVGGYMNTKNIEHKKEVLVLEDNPNIYKVEDFESILDNLPKSQIEKAKKHVDKLDGKLDLSFAEGVQTDELPESFIDLLYSNKMVFELFNHPTLHFKDRSAADMKLANILYSLKIPKKEALAVLSNTQKALEKGLSRVAYGEITIGKVYDDRTKNKFQTVGQKLKNGYSAEMGSPVKGPSFFDCLYRPWVKKQVLGLIAGPGVGKCLGLNTPILMFDGTIKMVQDIKVGDEVMGSDSTKRTVLNTVSGREEMYKVIPVKGDPYEVNKNHILSLKYCKTEERYGCKKGDILNISVKDYLNKSKKFKTAFKGYRVGVEFQEQEVLLSPYWLGLWLGDGNSKNVGLTTMDLECRDSFVSILKNYEDSNVKLKVHSKNNNRALTYTLTGDLGKDNNPIFKELKELELLNNKHIPRIYKINSREVRLQLLAGLIDSDGHLIHNCYEITQKNERLAYDIVFLARSLGFAAYIKKTKKQCVNNQVWGEYFRIFISGDIVDIPVKLDRKRAHPRQQVKDVLNTGIQIESLGEGDFYGFELDGDHLFVLGDFTVTHNSSVCLKTFKDMIENNVDNDDVYIFFSLEMPEQEMIQRWISLVGQDSPLADRLYVIGNEDDSGTPRFIGLQEIYEYANDIKMSTGKQIGSIAIDHIGILGKQINMKKKPTFGVEGEQDAGWGEVRTLSLNTIATQMKTLAKMLDTFLIVLTQTTKGKGAGDIPIDKDGAYGISQYENIMDYIITAWQPLMRVQDRIQTRYLAYQYCKIRNKHKLDKIGTYESKVLVYEMDTGDLRPPTQIEFLKFEELLPEAAAIREKLAKKEGLDYTPTVDLKSLKEALKNMRSPN